MITSCCEEILHDGESASRWLRKGIRFQIAFGLILISRESLLLNTFMELHLQGKETWKIRKFMVDHRSYGEIWVHLSAI